MIGKTSAPAAQPNKTISIAAIDVPFFTCTTCTIIDDWLHRHSSSNIDIVDAFSNLFYNATKFVTKSQRHLLVGDRVRSRGYEAGTSQVFMKVVDAVSRVSTVASNSDPPVPQMPTKAGLT